MHQQTALFDSLEAHVKTLHRVCESTNRDEIDTTESIATQSIEGDTARRLGLVTACNHLNSLACLFGIEIVEHNTLDTAHVNHLLQILECAHLDLNLQVLATGLAILLGT